MAGDSSGLLNPFAAPIAELLKIRGFKKKGLRFVADPGDALLIIQLQSSSSSTGSQKILTVNLGVYSKTLAAKLGEQKSSPTVWDCHWQERLGYLMKDPTDKWWTMSSEAEAQAAGQEAAGLLRDAGIPLLESLNSTERLRALWQRGESPGITPFTRDQYLEALSK
jgi:hypothetical protein